MASLTVPEDEMWVNLSPYEKDRIIADALSQTELGRDLLRQDYILKQVTASLMYPEEQLGNDFWERVYAKAQAQYGTAEIPVNTFNKVWIVPEKANVYVHGNNVFVVDNYLKVMLEEDYLALEANSGHAKHGVGAVPEDQVKEIGEVSKQIIREILIPEIEKEVNEGKNFANLRQIFNSMILATWYKKNLKESLLGQVYVNQNKVKGIDLDDKQVKEKIYNRYVKAFEKGVYNYIKEDYDEMTQEVILRKYFSGGIEGGKDVRQRGVGATERREMLDGNESVFTVENQSVDGAVLSRVVSPEELTQRFSSKKANDGRILIGLMRDKDDKIQPVFSDTSSFQSTREIKAAIPLFGTGWNPDREIRELPVAIKGVSEGVRVAEINRTSDWDSIPDEISALFESGRVFVTDSSPNDSGYSVLMAVTPANRSDKSKGRAGSLLKDGLPIVIEIAGKEFILEIKGIGNAEGGFDVDYRLLRGGAQTVESKREIESLEMKRKVGKAFDLGDSVRAVADLTLSVNGRQQGYLIRLAPGSVRATYNDNEAFKFAESTERVRRVARDMGKQMGGYFSEGFIPTSHPENLIVVDQGRKFIFTDYSDILPIGIFPTKIEGRNLDFFDVIRASLNIVTEVAGYKEHHGYQYFLEGLTEGLFENGKISEDDKPQLLALTDFDQIREFLWTKFFAADYYKVRKANGWAPDYFEYLQDSPDLNTLDKVVEKAKRKFEDNENEVASIRSRMRESEQKNRSWQRLIQIADGDFQRALDIVNAEQRASGRYIMEESNMRSYLEQLRSQVESSAQWQADKEREIAKLERQNRILENTEFTAEGIIEVTNSKDARKSLAAGMQSLSSDIYSAEYYFFWHLWGDNLLDYLSVSGHLNKEVEFLEVVIESIDEDLKDDVQANLEIARRRLEALRALSPHDYHQQLTVNPAYAREMGKLPYFAGESAVLSSERDIGGIDMNPNNLDLDVGGDEIKLDFTSDSQVLNNIRVDGYIPVIINVAPIKNIPLLIGKLEEEPEVDILSWR